MTSNSPDHPATAHPGTQVRGRPHPQRHRRGPSPEEGELLRRLTRSQIADRMHELGELYAQTAPSGPRRPRASNHSAPRDAPDRSAPSDRWAAPARPLPSPPPSADAALSPSSDRSPSSDPAAPSTPSTPSAQARSAAFRRRLADHMRRPGFELLVAETTRPSGATVLTACAYGFPVPDDGSWWQGLDGYLPANLSPAAPGGLFAIGDILVERRVRTQDQSRDWNLARRLQKRLLSDHTAVVGVMLVDRGDTDTLEALLSWGWCCLPSAPAAHRLLVLR